MKLEECLRQLMIDDFGSVSKFADHIGVPRTTIYNVLNRGVMGSGHDLVEKIYEALDVNWRVIGLDSDFSYEEFKKKRDSLRHPNEDSFVSIPLYGAIAAGTPIEMVPVDDFHPVPMKIKRKHPNAFLLKVEGDSMNRVLPNGSYALVAPSRKEPVIDNHAYAVCVNGYDATIKRVKKLANGIELIPDSIDPTYKPKVYDYGLEETETITIIGEIVWYTIPFDFQI